MSVNPLYTDDVLLFRIASGDERAFKIVYERWHAKVYLFASKYLKSTLDAEEVMQEVFLKLWLRDANALPISSLSAYFQTLVRNRSLDLLRHKAVVSSVDLERAVNWTEEHNETEQQIMLNDARKLLNQGIELLSPQQKQVYQLCHVEGLKYEEAAKQLGISAGTVHSHVKLALKFLRNHMRQNSNMAIFAIIFKLFL